MTVDGCVAESVAPMFSEAFGNQLRFRGKVPVSFVNCPYGVAAARLELLELRQNTIFSDARSEICVVFYDLALCVL